jgi:hypothetical protein
LLKEDYERINEGSVIEDLWFYQTLQNEDARRLVEDCFNLFIGNEKNTFYERNPGD